VKTEQKSNKVFFLGIRAIQTKIRETLNDKNLLFCFVFPDYCLDFAVFIKN
jgi:hypothetical protein